MRLAIKDSAFLPGRHGKSHQFLIWPKDFPQIHFDKMSTNQCYALSCQVNNDEQIAYLGKIYAKRRQTAGPIDVLVLMVPDTDIGKLLPTATIELDLSNIA